MSDFRSQCTCITGDKIPKLHILPVLQLDPFDRIEPYNVTLSVSASWLDQDPSPLNRGWDIYRPYPNQLYLVGGSSQCHLGHFISLPEGQQTGEVTFEWRVEAADLPPGHFQVTHRFEIAFGEGEGEIWSMDVANWWGKSEYATEGHEEPEIGRNRFSRLKRQGISPKRCADVSEELREGRRYVEIHESLSLPAIALSDCWTIDTYGGDAVHECLEALR